MFNYISLGKDCSTAAALRGLNLRFEALPFDWVVSNVFSLEACFKDNFLNYHKQLFFNKTQTRLIDTYGFQFVHDYPFMDDVSSNEINFIDKLGEGVFGENEKCIVEDWMEYYDIVKEKYNRRVERFKNIMLDTKPIIALCRYSNREIFHLHYLFQKYYNKYNIYFVNSNKQPISHKNIINVFTEKNGIWNESAIWNNAIEEMKTRIFIENNSNTIKTKFIRMKMCFYTF